LGRSEFFRKFPKIFAAQGLHPVSTTLAKMVEKFAAGVVDTLPCEYLCKFSKKFETILREYSGAGGKLIHEKNQKQKIS
jgi:hypothetical protein